MNRINTWFDSLEAPHRGIVFISLIFGWLIPSLLSDSITGVAHTVIVAVIAVWVVTAMAFCLYRMAQN